MGVALPFEVKQGGGVQRCVVCGKLTSTPILYKTCCMNKPVAFCSQVCASRWIREWMRNQEQVRGRARGNRNLRRFTL